MVVDFNEKLTSSSLAAEILRDAVQVFDTSSLERWIGATSPLAAWNVGMAGGVDVTGAFSAATGTFPAATAAFPVVTGAFVAATGTFPATGRAVDAEPGATLKKVFHLPRNLPGVRLPSAADLVGAARSAPLMMKLAALAGWLGREGRLVSDTDELSAADAVVAARTVGIQEHYLPYLWEYALTSGWLELSPAPDGKRMTAIIGRTAWRWANGDDSAALHVWEAVFAAVLATTLEVATSDDPAASRKLHFQGQGVVVAMLLFLGRRTGLTLDEISELIRDGAIGPRPRIRVRRAWDAWLAKHGDPAYWLLRELEALHAISMPDTHDRAFGLTPLAQWALREQVRLDKVNVPRIRLRPVNEMTVADLVLLASGISDGEFDAELAKWVTARGTDRAAGEILAFAAFTDPYPRIVAVNLVRRLGIDAYQAWQDAMQRPELRGYARMALSGMSGDDLAGYVLPALPDPGQDDFTWVAADMLTLACGEGQEAPDPKLVAAQLAEVVPVGDEARFFDMMSQNSHPDVVQVLTVLGRWHPNRQVAKEARRAARSAAKAGTARRATRAPVRVRVRA
jgi:hypothetical protein